MTKTNQQHVLTFLLGFMAIAMPNLNLLMSIGSILLFGFWLYSPGPKAGFRNLKENKLALAIIGLFALHLIWLLNTQNFDYAFKDLRIKLPLLIFGMVLGSIRMTKRQIQIVFVALSMGIWFASIQSYVNYADFVNGLHDHRQIVQGISHIRLSLLMVVLIAGVIYFWKTMRLPWRIYSAISVVNILMFFNVLQSLTGVAVLVALIVFTIIYHLVVHQKHKLLAVFSLLILGSPVGIYYAGRQYYHTYFTASPDELPKDERTAKGNKYVHDNRYRIVDNKHYVFTYICEPEMAEAWNSRSELKIDYTAQENTDLAATLIRYLASKGLRKDYEGVMALSDEDVRNIEIGFPSVLYIEKSGLALRLHSFMFSIHVYKQTGNASGLSFFQRIVYWNVAIELIKEHFWTGTGTGDLAQDFQSMYAVYKPNLDPKFRLRAHNQFLTFFASFGLLGFLYFTGLFALAFIKRHKNYLALACYTIAFLSCLVEDTLETQAGVTFFAFFFVLLSMPFTKEKAVAIR